MFFSVEDFHTPYFAGGWGNYGSCMELGFFFFFFFFEGGDNGGQLII